MGFFNRGMYFEFLYKQAADLIAKNDKETALKKIDDAIRETYGIPILVYHEISDKDNQYCVSKEEFTWQMDYLADNGYRFVTYDMLKHDEIDCHEKTVLISFDDARIGAFNIARPILDKRNIPIMMFVASSYQMIARESNLGDEISSFMTWDDLKTWMRDGNIDIGAHSHSHFDMSTLSKEQIEEEIETNNRIVSEMLGTDCKDFAFPYGKYKKEFLPLFEKHYETISTLASGLNYEGISKSSLRRTAVLRMFSGKDFSKLVDFSAIRNRFIELKKGL